MSDQYKPINVRLANLNDVVKKMETLGAEVIAVSIEKEKSPWLAIGNARDINLEKIMNLVRGKHINIKLVPIKKGEQ